jgi:hypothetical protein
MLIICISYKMEYLPNVLKRLVFGYYGKPREKINFLGMSILLYVQSLLCMTNLEIRHIVNVNVIDYDLPDIIETFGYVGRDLIMLTTQLLELGCLVMLNRIKNIELPPYHISYMIKALSEGSFEYAIILCILYKTSFIAKKEDIITAVDECGNPDHFKWISNNKTSVWEFIQNVYINHGLDGLVTLQFGLPDTTFIYDVLSEVIKKENVKNIEWFINKYDTDIISNLKSYVRYWIEDTFMDTQNIDKMTWFRDNYKFTTSGEYDDGMGVRRLYKGCGLPGLIACSPTLASIQSSEHEIIRRAVRNGDRAAVRWLIDNYGYTREKCIEFAIKKHREYRWLVT